MKINKLLESNKVKEDLDWNKYKITYVTAGGREDSLVFNTWQSDVEYAWRKSPHNIPHTKVKSIELLESKKLKESTFGFKNGSRYYGGLPAEPSASEYADMIAKAHTSLENTLATYGINRTKRVESYGTVYTYSGTVNGHSFICEEDHKGIKPPKLGKLEIDHKSVNLYKSRHPRGIPLSDYGKSVFDVIQILEEDDFSRIVFKDVTESKSIKEDASYEWKPNTSFKHIKDIYEKVKANGYKYVNNEREEFMAAVKKADAKGYKPEQRKQIRDWHRDIWAHNRKTESFEKEDRLNKVDNELKEAFKPTESGIQSVKCYNRYNYTIQELRVDNDNKTFERGNFTAGKADKKTKNRQEYEDIVDSLKELGYTEIKSDYHSLRNKTRKGVPTNEEVLHETEYGKDELWNQLNNNEYAYNTLAGVVKNGIEKGYTKTRLVNLVAREIFSMKDDFGRIPTTREERLELAKDFVEDETQGYSYSEDENEVSFRRKGTWGKNESIDFSKNERAVENFLNKYGFTDERYPHIISTYNSTEENVVVVSFTDGIEARDYRIMKKHLSGLCDDIYLGKKHKDSTDDTALWLTVEFEFSNKVNESRLVSESLGQDYSHITEVKSINYNNSKSNLLPYLDTRKFKRALEETGLEAFKIRTTRLNGVSNADLKDEFGGRGMEPWKYFKGWDTSVDGFNEFYFFFKGSLSKASMTESIDWNNLSGSEQMAAEHALFLIKKGTDLYYAVDIACNSVNYGNVEPEYEDEDFYEEEVDRSKVREYVKAQINSKLTESNDISVGNLVTHIDDANKTRGTVTAIKGNKATICVGDPANKDYVDVELDKLQLDESCDNTLNEEPNLSINDLKTFYNTATGIDKEKYPNFFVWYDEMVKSGKYKREDVNTKKNYSSEFYDNYVIIKNQSGDGYDIYSYSGTPENVKKLYLEDEGYATAKDAKAEIDKWNKDSKLDEAVVPSSIEFDDDIDDLSYYYDDEIFNDELENSPYTKISSKSVPDFDGFMTDYTMYMNINTGEYVFILGDNDIYDPSNTEPDWECETEEEAREWFNIYKGFIDEEDDVWEGYDFNLDEDVEKSPIIHKKSDGSYLVASEDRKSYVAYNKDDACMGNISANNETEAKNKFNSNTFDE